MGITRPTDQQLMRFARDERTTPIVMLNLLRYRERAAYPAGVPDTDVSGREAYYRYGMIAQAAIAAVGGRILWGAPCEQTVIGESAEEWDDVVAVWYPSRAAFLKMIDEPEYQKGHVHRDAGLERTVVIACHGPAEPTSG